MPLQTLPHQRQAAEVPAATKAAGGSPTVVEQIHFQLASPAVVASAGHLDAAVGAAVDAAAAAGVAVLGPVAAVDAAADAAADAVGGSLARPCSLMTQTPALTHCPLAFLAPVQ